MLEMSWITAIIQLYSQVADLFWNVIVKRINIRLFDLLARFHYILNLPRISETNGSIATKFYLKHHWGGGKAALGFRPDWIKTLVSMATESSHRVIMEKTVSSLFLGCFFILAGNDESSEEFEFSLIGPPTAELAALECLKKSP